MARMTLRICVALVLTAALLLGGLGAPAIAQASFDREATGGATTLEDILARQEGLKVDQSFRRDAVGDPDSAAPITGQLGTLGGASDPDLWRALRFGSADVTVASRSPAADVIIQDSGMTWLSFREGPLLEYGGYLLLAMLALLALFYLLRGRIRIDGGWTGQTVLRFTSLERFGHWLMAGSFIVLGLTGLMMLFGRVALIPLFGKDIYAPIMGAGKWVHNNVAWAFMLGLAMVTVMWVAHNIPNRQDLVWLAKGGGLFSKGVHPPARKFNAGQKIIFWLVVLLGVSISLSGLSLLFPFEMPMFAKTFDILNATGLPQLLGLGELPATMTPHQEMQFAQGWHAIVAFVFIAVILAHIYIGSVGMEGAFDAMGSGQVDVQWAKEHHSLWYEDVTGQDAHHRAPAE
ncbi:formate dehydrogenase subunit gamma [Defluviimonas sp. WL0002]|uniref:Formate dehydrogenase subunit gamma n=1 Tax=Albidovulum marisflavi TaxID=2984159 RepID=A0ABT2ZDM5_9RHOB|nr:formate dehydrogenase subunit gamma [Defluviimonas sp. WL0002]MCV2869224.1 formate dehydrogenase subunit gamma [Defluviimonas sp. WL0002]